LRPDQVKPEMQSVPLCHSYYEIVNANLRRSIELYDASIHSLINSSVHRSILAMNKRLPTWWTLDSNTSVDWNGRLSIRRRVHF